LKGGEQVTAPFCIKSRLSDFSFGFSQEHAKVISEILEEELNRLTRQPRNEQVKQRLGTVAVFLGVFQQLK
jgi:hypothetical protein